MYVRMEPCWNCGEPTRSRPNGELFGSYHCARCDVAWEYCLFHGYPRPKYTHATLNYVDHATVKMSSPA